MTKYKPEYKPTKLKIKLPAEGDNYIEHVGGQRYQDPRWCHVVNINGTQIVCLPDGTVIPGIQMTRATVDQNDKHPSVLLKLIVNVSEGELLTDEEPG